MLQFQRLVEVVGSESGHCSKSSFLAKTSGLLESCVPGWVVFALLTSCRHVAWGQHDRDHNAKEKQIDGDPLCA